MSGQFPGNVSYAVDLVMCIDCTDSMAPAIERVKGMALDFHDDLTATMEELTPPKVVDQLRVKVVAFRDVRVDEDAFQVSDFFDLPAQRGDFEAFVKKLEHRGGGDEPESGLEALAEAMHSDWETGHGKRRHVVVLFTDASAHELGTREIGTSGFRMPASLGALAELWGDEVVQGIMEYQAKRLLLIAPPVHPWTAISDSWENVIHLATKAGRGLEETHKSTILQQIAGSV